MYTAGQITTEAWYKHTRTWNQKKYFDAKAEMNPNVAEAGSAHAWEITVILGKDALNEGDHIAVEIPVTWLPDMGRPFLYGRRLLSKEWNPGYSATPKFILPENVKCDFDVTPYGTPDSYFIIDAVITKGKIPPEVTFKIVLANPEGTLMRCQWFAQETPIPVAVKKR